MTRSGSPGIGLVSVRPAAKPQESPRPGLGSHRPYSCRGGEITADARALPFRTSSVDLIITNPPYSRSVDWVDYFGEMDRATIECRRVLKPTGRAFMLLPVGSGREHWFVFNKVAGRWRHTGHTVRTQAKWGVVPDDQVAPIVECHSQPGDIVLDPFTGANNIPRLACQMGRVGIGSGLET
jgi:SAM-dependent methyltransferase